VRLTTPLNRLLGFADDGGRAAVGGSLGARQRRLGWPPSAAQARWGACGGRASTLKQDDPETLLYFRFLWNIQASRSVFW
jgi:hypothetical protein